MTTGDRMSAKLWTEVAAQSGAPRRQYEAPPAAAQSVPAPELVKSDAPIADPFADPPAYEAVRSLHTRSHDAFFFIPGEEVPYQRPYAYYQGAEPIPDGSGLRLHWPGIRFEVRGEHVPKLMMRLATRRADVWRPFRPGYHVAPDGATIIRSIRVVVENEDGPR